MSTRTKRELLDSLVREYRDADRKRKTELVDTLLASTQYDRKYAIKLLSAGSRGVGTVSERKPRSPKLSFEAQKALILLWNVSNRICSKRFVPGLGDLLDNLEKSKHLILSDQAKAEILSISASTVDRMLKAERAKSPRSLSHTKRNALVKNKVPIRTFTEWNDVLPGFFEIDTVAHSSSSSTGPFLSTLNMTDIATCWTIPVAIRRKSAIDVISALNHSIIVMPFPLLGLDFDNGSEFLNEELISWCIAKNVTYTRSREYKKNDQAWIEEKNGSVVRRTVGRDRYQGTKTFKVLQELYAVLSIYYNFFQPCQKLLYKSRNGAKTYKRHDLAKTPYQRVLENPHITEDCKCRLRLAKEQLSVFDLFNKMHDLQTKLSAEAVLLPDPVRSAIEAQRNATQNFVVKHIGKVSLKHTLESTSKPDRKPMDALREFVNATEPGTYFKATDMLHLASRASLDQCLARLKLRGVIEKVSWGTYQIPLKSEKRTTPEMDCQGVKIFEATV